MNKKGQAAMEFLMTYGWAILAAIIAIGALAWFGVFRPNVPEMCTISAPFSCNADSAIVQSTDDLSLILINGPEDVTITDIKVLNCVAVAATDNVNPDVDIGTGGSGTFVISCDTDYGDGDRFTTPIDIRYTAGTGTRELRSSGNIVRRVDPS